MVPITIYITEKEARNAQVMAELEGVTLGEFAHRCVIRGSNMPGTEFGLDVPGYPGDRDVMDRHRN